MPSLLSAAAVFILLIPFGGLAVASAWRRPAPVQAFSLGVGTMLAGLFALGFATHAAGCPRAVWWSVPPLLAGLGFARRRAIGALLADPGLRAVLAGWALFALWGLVLLATVRSYSGGFWLLDWMEHYERAVFFLEGGPSDQRFLMDVYPLTARPPFTNVVTALPLYLCGGGFAAFQVITTLLGSLAFLPLALLANRWTGRAAVSLPVVAALALLLVANPMTAEHLTFAWTKLPAAAWVLGGSYALLLGLDDRGGRVARVLGFAALGCALLNHYSAGPWIAVWVAAYLWHFRRDWKSPRFWRETGLHALVAALVLGPWILWAAQQLGWSSVFGSNTTAQFAENRSLAGLAADGLRNIRDTLIPFPFRSVGDPFPPQASAWGRLRDYCFNLYQMNLPLTLGLAGLTGLALRAKARLTRPDLARLAGWLAGLAGVTALGIVVNVTHYEWGLAHICLLPLTLAALAWLAPWLASAPPVVLALWGTAAAVDFALGIGLHFLLQSSFGGQTGELGVYAKINANSLLRNHLQSAGALLSPGPAVSAALLAGGVAATLWFFWHARRTGTETATCPRPPR